VAFIDEFIFCMDVIIFITDIENEI